MKKLFLTPCSLSSRPRHIEAQPGAIDDYFGAAEAHPELTEDRSEAMEDQPGNVISTLCHISILAFPRLNAKPRGFSV
jgi:hypothetical protein